MGVNYSNKDTAIQKYAKYIDHTLLKVGTTLEQIKKLCDEAMEYHFGSVCVNPCFVKASAEMLKGSGVNVATVIGFPLGATTTEVKRMEAREALQNGASEVDMVMNIGALKGNDFEFVKQDIQAVVSEAHSAGGIIKVIIETCVLSQEEKIKACEIIKEVGADFVKTSTGFSTGGATVEDVALLKKVVGPDVEVKASTGIKTVDDFLSLVKAGATRFGTSSGIRIIEGLKTLEEHEKEG